MAGEVWRHHHDEIRLREKRVAIRVLRAEALLFIGRKARAIVVEHAHVEAARTPRDRLADASMPMMPSVA